MTAGEWAADELRRVGDAEEIRVCSTRADGSTSKPVIVWVVRHGENLYFRSVRGPGSSWFRAARARGKGQLRVGGAVMDVRFVDEASKEVNRSIDQAYAEKYRQYARSIIDSINSPDAQSTTLRLEPAL